MYVGMYVHQVKVGRIKETCTLGMYNMVYIQCPHKLTCYLTMLHSYNALHYVHHGMLLYTVQLA